MMDPRVRLPDSRLTVCRDDRESGRDLRVVRGGNVDSRVFEYVDRRVARQKEPGFCVDVRGRELDRVDGFLKRRLLCDGFRAFGVGKCPRNRRRRIITIVPSPHRTPLRLIPPLIPPSLLLHNQRLQRCRPFMPCRFQQPLLQLLDDLPPTLLSPLLGLPFHPLREKLL